MPASRTKSLLQSPPTDPGELADFPEHLLGKGNQLHRIHRTDLSPWFFSSGPLWRFSPCEIVGLGACYLAEQPVTGLLETFKGFQIVDETELRTRSQFSVVMDRQLRLADCCATTAARFGVNGEIHTTPDYDRPQKWASALAQAGFAGIRYLCRSDPGMQLIGYALFDRAGPASAGRWPDGTDVPVDEATVREAEVYGLRISPTR